MPEGMTPQDVGREIAGHAKHGSGQGHDRRDRIISIAEAVLLSIVALLAAYSGYAAAKWTTEQRVDLAASSGARSKATRAHLQAINLRNFDASTFNAWFSAYTAHNRQAMELAERRFRPQFKVAFDAWRRTHPETDPNAPKGPTYMPQYKQPDAAKSRRLDDRANAQFDAGAKAGEESDKYIRTTVFLASVLFLVGISTQFPIRGARYGLVAVGTGLLIISLVQLAQLPGPP